MDQNQSQSMYIQEFLKTIVLSIYQISNRYDKVIYVYILFCKKYFHYSLDRQTSSNRQQFLSKSIYSFIIYVDILRVSLK